MEISAEGPGGSDILTDTGEGQPVLAEQRNDEFVDDILSASAEDGLQISDAGTELFAENTVNAEKFIKYEDKVAQDECSNDLGQTLKICNDTEGHKNEFKETVNSNRGETAAASEALDEMSEESVEIYYLESSTGKGDNIENNEMTDKTECVDEKTLPGEMIDTLIEDISDTKHLGKYCAEETNQKAEGFKEDEENYGMAAVESLNEDSYEHKAAEGMLMEMNDCQSIKNKDDFFEDFKEASLVNDNENGLSSEATQLDQHHEAFEEEESDYFSVASPKYGSSESLGNGRLETPSTHALIEGSSISMNQEGLRISTNDETVECTSNDGGWTPFQSEAAMSEIEDSLERRELPSETDHTEDDYVTADERSEIGFDGYNVPVYDDDVFREIKSRDGEIVDKFSNLDVDEKSEAATLSDQQGYETQDYLTADDNSEFGESRENLSNIDRDGVLCVESGNTIRNSPKSVSEEYLDPAGKPSERNTDVEDYVTADEMAIEEDDDDRRTVVGSDKEDDLASKDKLEEGNGNASRESQPIATEETNEEASYVEARFSIVDENSIVDKNSIVDRNSKVDENSIVDENNIVDENRIVDRKSKVDENSIVDKNSIVDENSIVDRNSKVDENSKEEEVRENSHDIISPKDDMIPNEENPCEKVG